MDQSTATPSLAHLSAPDCPLAIIGLGYVGLPLAVEFGKHRPVGGFDIHPARIAETHRRDLDSEAKCYNRPVATFVVLTDDHPNWRPVRYEHALWGCRAVLEFPQQFPASVYSVSLISADLEVSFSGADTTLNTIRC